MSHILSMSQQNAVRQLHAQGHSGHKIARLLRVNRRTVSRYVGQDTPSGGVPATESPSGDSKCATPGVEVTTGSAGLPEAKCTTAAAKVTTGSRSRCEAFTEIIGTMAGQGLNARRIHQDLVAGHGFKGSYPSVRRFVAKLRATPEGRVWRIECAAGEEVQVDFGVGAPIKRDGGRLIRPWVFRAVLSHSRKGYSEVVLRQDTESFLRVIENALRHFGGVPKLLNMDNLKAAVRKADWLDPELNPKLVDFCRHYGITPMPCRPYTPQHKGKVERGVAYVKGNALKGRVFNSLAEQNAHLAHWETHVADKRVHGTTRRQVEALFAVERETLGPLPPDLFSSYQEGRRRVARDGFVEVDKSWYEAPPEYIGREVWARWDGRTVRVLNDRMEQIALHTRGEPGKFSRCLGVRGFNGTVTQTIARWEGRAAAIGEAAGQWASRSLAERGAEGVRSVMGLCALAGKHHASEVNGACARAMEADSRLPALRSITALIKGTADNPRQAQMNFREEDPVIRGLDVYAGHVRERGGTDPFPAEAKTNNNNNRQNEPSPT